jgi:hypothetical protein
MNRAFQVFALCLSIGLLVLLACRAQTKPAGAPANAAGDNANPAASGDAGVDAPARPKEEVYFPASKSGGAFLEHQQAPH